MVDHKPGSNSGIDYGVLIVVLLWIVASIALLIVIARNSRNQSSFERSGPSSPQNRALLAAARVNVPSTGNDYSSGCYSPHVREPNGGERGHRKS
jgi:hypothetical protein